MAHQGGSRLQKLLRLIEDATNLDTRKAAADQIAVIVATHPPQLPSVIHQVSIHLRSNEWDARIAAAHCLGAIAEHFVHHTPADLAKAAGLSQADAASTIASATPGEALLTFNSFDINAVVERGTPLLASGGEEYDGMPGSSGTDDLARQRDNLKKRLGLGGAAEQFVDADEIFADEDLRAISKAGPKVKEEGKEMQMTGAVELLAGMSARERTAASRKAKAAKRRNEYPVGDEPSGKRIKDDDGIVVVPSEERWQAVLSGCWPFQNLCDQLCMDLLHPRWQIRHGAALGLREILRTHAPAAAVAAPVRGDASLGWSTAAGSGPLRLGIVKASDVNAATAANAAWLEDCAIHLLCTLALDRFGDYTSDQVVAPVRETAAQALGVVVHPVTRPTLLRLIQALGKLAECPLWQPRHGALQGLKYVLAARVIDEEILGAALPVSIIGLVDTEVDDDVRAVAAEALLPAAFLLRNARSPDAFRARILLWDTLLIRDELSPAVKSATSVLSALYTQAKVTDACLENESATPLSSLVTRLFPHFRHALTSVRIAVVNCLGCMLRSFAATGKNKETTHLIADNDVERTARLLFQNFILEKDGTVLRSTESAWEELIHRVPKERLAGRPLTSMFALASTPPQGQFDRKHMISVDGIPFKTAAGAMAEELQLADGGRTAHMRLFAARALGELGRALGPLASDIFLPPLLEAMNSTLASARVLSGFVVASWAQKTSLNCVDGDGNEAEPGLLTAAAAALSALGAVVTVHDELKPLLLVIQKQASALADLVLRAGLSEVSMPAAIQHSATMWSVEAGASLALQVLSLSSKAPSHLIAPAQALQTSVSSFQTSDMVLRASVGAALAAAVVHSKRLPAKLNAVIQPLIAAVRREPQPLYQEEAATALACLIVACTKRTPSPADKIIRNVCGFAVGDPAVVPNAASPPPLGAEMIEDAKDKGAAQKAAETSVAQATALSRRGGEATLRAVAVCCGRGLPSILPVLWQEKISDPIIALSQQESSAMSVDSLQGAIEGLRLLEVMSPALHGEVVRPHVLSLLPHIGACLSVRNSAVQLASTCALAAAVASWTDFIMSSTLVILTPMLDGGAPDASRLGAVVALRQLVTALGLKMVPYVQLAVIPLLGRMSDAHPEVRAVASSTFASVVALMPLAQGKPPPPGISPEQRASLEKEGRFLQQLLDNRQMDDFVLPFQLKTGTLRRYQQEGINWLGFLRRFGLHGVLADDMGLGKTLQATAIIAATTLEAKQRFATSGDPATCPRPSLIVCPATLVAHWPHEIAKFVDPAVLRPLQYHGTPDVRAALRSSLPKYDVVVMSYESLRADISWISQVKWAYCVLDEGHAIRNPSSKLAQAAHQVNAQHRLILSGTPIQNSVLEMWALFQFLMPGFLGSERTFNARFGKATTASRTAKRGSAQAEAGVLALDALHRQVMPFVLRRTKDQVLQDLPPKTVQDVICDPGQLQRQLYEDFEASQAMAAVTGAVQQGALAATSKKDGGEGATAAPHVFQALHYLRRLCSHPLLVLDQKVPAHVRAVEKVLGPKLAADWPAALKAIGSNLTHSPKLAALRELLIDCGIGTDAEGSAGVKEEALAASDAGHRALIFAQTRALLDLVESQVLAPMSVTSLRIDGSVDAAERFRQVQIFNADPTVEVMLLTTAVGGLGLNLTAADTVIFLEHDWNPQKDLQAMDRAHRLGQRRAVNVYRLLVRGTLEEHVMSLQRFKLDVAAAVVNVDNVSLSSMDTGNLLELFTLDDGGERTTAKRKPGGGEGSGALAAILADSLDPAAAEAQYGEEFDLEAFKLKLLGKQST